MSKQKIPTATFSFLCFAKKSMGIRTNDFELKCHQGTPTLSGRERRKKSITEIVLLPFQTNCHKQEHLHNGPNLLSTLFNQTKAKIRPLSKSIFYKFGLFQPPPPIRSSIIMFVQGASVIRRILAPNCSGGDQFEKIGLDQFRLRARTGSRLQLESAAQNLGFR